MAMCLAESIVDTGQLDPADQLRRYLLWRDAGYWSSTGACFDIGTTTRRALDRFAATGATVEPNPDEAVAANGSLMRLAPVPVRWYADVAEAAARSAESSRTTHAARRPTDSCAVLGAMLAALIQGVPADEVLAGEFWQYGPLHPEVAAVARGSWRVRQPPDIRGSGYSVAALEAALWAVGGADDFRAAVLRAANLGDDADTTAAIAGQLAGARWGRSGIPDEWRAQLVRGARITALADRLHQAGGGGAPARWPHDDFLHAWWVAAGSVLAGEFPGHPDAGLAAEKVNLLLDHGIRTFVDLTTPDDGLTDYAEHVAAAAAARRLDLRHTRHPIPDFGVVGHDDYSRILATITAAAGRGGVYVHCWGGVGRTGTVVACLLIDQGLDVDAALARLTELRAGTSKADRPSPENATQLDVVRERAARR
jgi:ADP-ribosylglycohydrolase